MYNLQFQHYKQKPYRSFVRSSVPYIGIIAFAVIKCYYTITSYCNFSMRLCENAELENRRIFLSNPVKNAYILQSVDTALALLDFLCDHPNMGIADISRALSIGKSTAFRLLFTLENRGFIKKGPDLKYCLGPKFIRMGSLVLESFDIIRYARPFLIDLCNTVSETVHLVIWEEGTDSVRFIDKVLSAHTIRMQSFVGLIQPAYTTGTGKVILANRSDEFIEGYLQRVKLDEITPYTITDRDTLYQALMDIRQNGYGADINESEIGLTCYAAPIFGPSGNVIAAISASGPSERVDTKKELLISSVKEASKSISDCLL